MKQPKKRLTTSIGEYPTSEGMFALYPNKIDSVDDLILYMQEFSYPKNLNSAEKLVKFMKQKGYFETPEKIYLEGVKSKIK